MRRPTLRERVRASQALCAAAPQVGPGAAAGPLAAGGWPGAQAPQPAAPPSDENEGSNSQPNADLLQLGSKQALSTSFAQPAAQRQAGAQLAAAQQQQQRSVLDDAMADLDAGLRAQQTEAAGQQQAEAAGQQQAERQQVERQQAERQGGHGRQSGRSSGSASRPSSLFDELFGPDPRASDAAAAEPTAAAAEAPPAPPPAQNAAAGPAADCGPAASGGPAAGPAAGPRSVQQPEGWPSGRAQRTSSRLRPATQQQQQPAAALAEQHPLAAQAVPAAGPATGPVLAVAAALEAEGAGSGSEPQDDVARALDK